MSCLANYDMEDGAAYVSFMPASNTSNGQAQECAQECQSDGRCDAFTLSSSSGCSLRSGKLFSAGASSGSFNQSGIIFSPSTDVVLSCTKSQDDFVGAGAFGAVAYAGKTSECRLAAFVVGMHLNTTHSALQMFLLACTASLTIK